MPILEPTNENIELAAHALRQGEPVAFATETVYGLGCDTFNIAAIKRVYIIKNRPVDNPMIAHILESSWVTHLTNSWDATCESLAEAFWPGPLTLVVRKHERVPVEACGGRETIAIRCPANNVARKLLLTFGGPVSAPSANRSGYISPTSAEHVESEFGSDLSILDGGICEEGIESTVLSLLSEPAILRPGTISRKQIEQVIGPVLQKPTTVQSESPGTSAVHYAPSTPTKLKSRKEIATLQDPGCFVLSIHETPALCGHHIKMPSSPKQYGTVLYSTLREADSKKASAIMIEQPPIETSWDAINDRLSRCTTK